MGNGKIAFPFSRPAASSFLLRRQAFFFFELTSISGSTVVIYCPGLKDRDGVCFFFFFQPSIIRICAEKRFLFEMLPEINENGIAHTHTFYEYNDICNYVAS